MKTCLANLSRFQYVTLYVYVTSLDLVLQVWPKVIELAAPIPFLAMIPPGYIATAATQKTAFITIKWVLPAV